MIINIIKDYSVSDMCIFAEESPTRYKNLCKIVGEFALGVRHLHLGIVLPFSGDYGAVSAGIIKDEVINVIDIKYF